MPSGKCVKCGAVYYGWSLVCNKNENTCPICGGEIEVTRETEPLKVTIK